MIRKRTINLVIRQEQLLTPYVRVNRILPRIAAGCLGVFLLIYGAIFIYLQVNIGQFERMKADIDRLEQSIAQKKISEGLYGIAYEDVSVIEHLMKEKKNYPRLVTELLQLQSPQVTFSSITITPDNQITVSVAAQSSSVLEDFTSRLVVSNQNKPLYTHILAQGILRDRVGGYSLTLSMIPNPTLLQ